MDLPDGANQDEVSLSSRLRRIIEPPEYYTTPQDRMRYQFILGFTIVASPLLILSQIVSSEGLFGNQVFSFAALVLLIGFLLCLYGFMNEAIFIDLLCFSAYPYLSLFYKDWDGVYSFLVITWIPITMLLGGYLLSKRFAALFIVAQDIAFLSAVLFHAGAAVLRSAFLESVIPLFAASLLIYSGSWIRQLHIDKLDQMNQELESKNRELNIYTSLLVHDVGSDLQASMLNTELASQLVLSDSTSAREHIQTAHTVERRISALLKLFSEPTVDFQSDIVSLIETIAEDAQLAHRDLKISVEAEDQCRSLSLLSRLLPMVFINLFRNSAMHAGEDSTVAVSISLQEDDVQIKVVDNGPGIDESIRPKVFQKGISGVESNSSGMGLYLVKQIIDTHNGTISLLNENECRGCGFLITLPRENFASVL